MPNREHEGYRDRPDYDEYERGRRQQSGSEHRGRQGQGGFNQQQQRGEEFSRHFSTGSERGGNWPSDRPDDARGDYGSEGSGYEGRYGSRRESFGARNPVSPPWHPESEYNQGGASHRTYGGHSDEYSSQRWPGASRPYGGQERDYRRGERDFWDKASDEVSSWFGDEEARRRREMDQHRGKGPRNYTRSDERIKDDVNDRLTEDGMVDATDIDVEVRNREVTLSGQVGNRMAKRRAEDIAESVSGVTHVQNNLRVRQDETTGASVTLGNTTLSDTNKGKAGL